MAEFIKHKLLFNLYDEKNSEIQQQRRKNENEHDLICELGIRRLIGDQKFFFSSSSVA